jgi:hypothetical protein
LLNQQLSLQFFQQQIGSEQARHIRKVTFCGNDGDPIYCRDLIDICAWFKQHNANVNIVIITNGSYRAQTWWHNLGRVLDHHDEIHWSIDGWDQDSNQQYRINSNWQSIMLGIAAFQSSNHETYRIWDTIAFSFNQDHLSHIRQEATRLAFDAWQLTKSTKFGSHYPEAYGVDDSLCPTDRDLVADGHRFQRCVHSISSRPRPGTELRVLWQSRADRMRQQGQYAGICLIGNKGVFLNSRGELYPCCWTANRYSHNEPWLRRAEHEFNLRKFTLCEIKNHAFWQNEFLQFESQECKSKCTHQRLTDPHHVLEW